MTSYPKQICVQKAILLDYETGNYRLELNLANMVHVGKIQPKPVRCRVFLIHSIINQNYKTFFEQIYSQVLMRILWFTFQYSGSIPFEISFLLIYV